MLHSTRKLHRQLKTKLSYDVWVKTHVKDKFVKNKDWRVKKAGPINHYLCCNRVDVEITEKVLRKILE